MSDNKKNVDLNKVSYNFGTKGWTVIGFEIVMLFFMTGITVDGLNTIVPMMAEYHGWNPDVLLSISTPASIIALFACVLWAAFIEKAGLKKTTIITMVLAGISMIAYGNSVNIAMYAVSLVCIVTFINAFACNCGFAICANWFPTKKGIVMGITTIGMNLASALINWILSGLSGQFQISGAISILGGVVILLAILLGIFVKATPEEAGCYPDNDPEIAAIIKAEEEGVKEMEKVSYAGALKNKYVWIFGLGAGFFGLATVGIMSQLVSYFMAARGYELTGALSMLTIAAVIGMIGSWAWGIVDQKLGHQLLARSVVARNQHARVGRSHLFDQLLHMLDTDRGPDDLGRGAGSLGDNPRRVSRARRGTLFTRRGFDCGTVLAFILHSRADRAE